jgi:predicted GNAT family acetyltransferase
MLDDVRERGLSIRPLCPFVLVYIRGHDEYADLVAA